MAIDLEYLARDLTLTPDKNPKAFLDRLAFRCYIKHGHVPPRLARLRALAAHPDFVFKFNPYHDPHNGQFTAGPGGVTPVSDDVSGQAPKSWENPKTLEEYFQDHGADFGAKSPQDYADRANQFYKRVQQEKLPAVQDSTDVVRAYDPKTNTFGSYNPDGTTRTFYKPPNGTSYFQEQIDRDAPNGGQMINPLPEETVPEIEVLPIIE